MEHRWGEFTDASPPQMRDDVAAHDALVVPLCARGDLADEAFALDEFEPLGEVPFDSDLSLLNPGQ